MTLNILWKLLLVLLILWPSRWTSETRNILCSNHWTIPAQQLAISEQQDNETQNRDIYEDLLECASEHVAMHMAMTAPAYECTLLVLSSSSPSVNKTSSATKLREYIASYYLRVTVLEFCSTLTCSSILLSLRSLVQIPANDFVQAPFSLHSPLLRKDVSVYFSSYHNNVEYFEN